MKKALQFIGLMLVCLGFFLAGIKRYVLIPFICLLLASKLEGQTAKQLRDHSQKPLTDTAYVYIEGRYKCKDDKTLIEVWQQDLQTGERWFTLCPKDGYIPKQGKILRMSRKTMEFIEP